MLLIRGSGNGPVSDGRTELRHISGHPPPVYSHANGGPTPGRSHSGSGWTSPAAGYTAQARHQGELLGGYEPAGRPVMDQQAKSGYGSPLDLSRTDYSNASELSNGAALPFSSVALRMHSTT